MAERSAISWTDATFNPWIGCTKVSPACDNCYAERDFDHRYGKVKWGPGNPRVRTSAANWKKPLRWNRVSAAGDFRECISCGRRESRICGASCSACLSFPSKPVKPRVFCASLADVFDNEVDPSWRSDLFKLIKATPNLDWLLLTKRIGNVKKLTGGVSAWPNVWLGATAVNQEEADRDIPKLLATPAAKRFLSIEPMLGAIDLTRWLDPTGVSCPDVCPDDRYVLESEYETAELDDGEVIPFCRHCGTAATWTGYDPGVDWVIVGGESGPKARPMHPQWVLDLRDQCDQAGVAFHFKQWGAWRPPLDGEEFSTANGRAQHIPAFIVSRDFGTVHCFEGKHIVDGAPMLRVGEKAAGRLLDGREHNGFPGERQA